ncbi:MAG: SET domain-containing protein [Patescibacteria group bacterium]
MSFQKSKELPHINVYTRLAPSKIQGVGVFAISDIPKGTNIFQGDEEDMVWISKDRIDEIDPDIKKLYDDFCVIKGDKLGCPKNFNSLTVAWYINESKDNPNVQCDDNYEFIAVRDIKKGEELTTDYSTYSE